MTQEFPLTLSCRKFQHFEEQENENTAEEVFIFARDMYNYHKSAMLHLYEIQKNCMENIWFTAPIDNIVTGG